MAKKKDRLTAAEAAELLGVVEGTFRSYVSRGQAPQSTGRDPETGVRLWDRADLTVWMKERPGRGRWGR